MALVIVRAKPGQPGTIKLTATSASKLRPFGSRASDPEGTRGWNPLSLAGKMPASTVGAHFQCASEGGILPPVVVVIPSLVQTDGLAGASIKIKGN